MKKEVSKQFEIQSREYTFPYHYLVDLNKKSFSKTLSWGLDYFNYMSTVVALVKKYIASSILDIGCGDGFLLYNLKKNNLIGDEIQAVGVDIDERPIKFAQAFSHGMQGLCFLQEDISNFEGRFQLICAIETLEHIPDEEVDQFLMEIDRLLDEGGILIVSVPSQNVPVTDKHYRHYTVSMLKGYFSKYEMLERHFMTKKMSRAFRFIEGLLCNPRFALSSRFFRRVLFYLNRKYMWHVREEQCGHIVAALRKPPVGKAPREPEKVQ